MAVIYDEIKKIFSLHTRNSTYQMKADGYGYLLHLYYGKKISADMDYLLPYYDRGFSGNPYDAGEDRTYSLDVLPQEFPVLGTGDFRNNALKIRGEDGCYGCDLRYVSHRILSGKYALLNLPASYADESAAQTLEIVLGDKRCGIKVTLLYGVLEECDIIARSVKIENIGNRKIYLEKVSSTCLDFLYGDYDVIAFYGRHAMERNVQRAKVIHGRQVFGSARGTSSHQYNPFVILAQHNAAEQMGECYGVGLVYSGNFSAEVEKDQFDQTRFVMGLSEEQFSYPLSEGEVFYAPEAVLSYSGWGIARLSHNFHRLAREHICRGKYKNQVRPVLLNSWEACYFNFDGEKIISLAEQAAELGVELLVLDDGWFGQRNDDNSSLGDWVVNEEKLGCSLAELSERVHQKGVKFGIWLEPEMVSEDSDLYRSHPDWALQIPGKNPVRARNQLVLDFSNSQVVEYILEKISCILRQGKVDYVKWDMNRSLTDIYSANAKEQGAVSYEYMLGVYRLLESLTSRFSDILWEGCCGGGGRFDLGMLYYTPQIWCSDNTDAADRVLIQYGTSFGYPLSAVGAHVSAVPNHQTGRVTSLNTRGVVAMTGAFGYELDFGKLHRAEKEEIREQIAMYHKIAPLMLNGEYYRITDPYAEEYGAWMVVDTQKNMAVLSVVILNIHGNMPVVYVRLLGLDPAKKYRESRGGKVYLGEALMEGGLALTLTAGDYQAYQIMLEAEA